MKRYFYCICILGAFCLMMSGLTSCKQIKHRYEPKPKEDLLTFIFTLQCSEDFLNFVTPTATYIDASGVEQNVEISSSSFVLATNNDGLIDKTEPLLYSWNQEIVLSNTRTGQRDMRITYKKRSDAPNIDNEKTYVMYHKLSSGHTINLKEGGSMTYIDLSVVLIDGKDPNRKDVTGENLPAYLYDIENASDYTKEIAN